MNSQIVKNNYQDNKYSSVQLASILQQLASILQQVSDFRAVTRKEGAISVQSNHPPAANTVSFLGRHSLATVQPVAYIQLQQTCIRFSFASLSLASAQSARKEGPISVQWKYHYHPPAVDTVSPLGRGASSFASPWLPCS